MCNQAPHTLNYWAVIFVPVLFLAAFVSTVVAVEPTLTEAEGHELIAAIEADAQWAKERLSQQKSDHIDREIVIDQLDYDGDAIKSWVAENTIWVPYTGTLRGADGVLMDRRGNSLDRSLLLMALLMDAGYEARLARSELSIEVAEQILTKASDGMVRRVGPKFEAGENLNRLFEELETNSQKLAVLAGLDGQEKASEASKRLLAAVRDHWWVQVKEGSVWENVDLLIPEGSAISRPTPQETHADLTKLPDDLDHSLILNVLIERWEMGKLLEENALSHTLTPNDALRGHTLELEFNPFNQAWMDDSSQKDLDPQTIANEAKLWLPILKVDGKDVDEGEWISETGQLVKDPMRWAVDIKLGQATSAISSIGSSGSQETAQSYLTAVWLEYVINRPGQEPRIVRRELSDILGVDRRESQALQTWAIDEQKARARGFDLQTNSMALVSIAMPQREALEHAIYERWINNRSSQIAMVYLAAGWEDDRTDPSLRTANQYPIDLMGMMTARSLWSQHRDRIYLDEINVWSNHLVWGPDPVETAGVLATDIVSNHVGVFPSNASEARLLRIEQGMLDTFIEQQLAVDESEPNAYGRFADHDSAGGDWRSLNSAAQETWPQDLPPNETNRLATAISDGAHVVVLDPPSESGGLRYSHWWQIDPQDGTTLGKGYRGWGTQYTERGAIKIISKVFDAAQKRGIVVRACKIGSAIVKVVNVVTVIQNPVMIDINYVIELERRSLYVTQQRSRWRLCPK